MHVVALLFPYMVGTGEDIPNNVVMLLGSQGEPIQGRHVV